MLLAAVILPVLAVGFVVIKTLTPSSQNFGSSIKPGALGSSDPIGAMRDALANERKVLANFDRAIGVDVEARVKVWRGQGRRVGGIRAN